jgi:hypothetical protein
MILELGLFDIFVVPVVHGERGPRAARQGGEASGPTFPVDPPGRRALHTGARAKRQDQEGGAGETKILRVFDQQNGKWRCDLPIIGWPIGQQEGGSAPCDPALGLLQPLRGLSRCSNRRARPSPSARKTAGLGSRPLNHYADGQKALADASKGIGRRKAPGQRPEAAHGLPTRFVARFWS